MIEAALLLALKMQPDPRELPTPTLTTCEAIASGVTYRNQVVRVRGELRGGFEFFGLLDTDCLPDRAPDNRIWLETTDKETPYAPGVTFKDFAQAHSNHVTEEFAASLQWVVPAHVEFLPDEASKRLSKLLKRDKCAMATVLGRLDVCMESKMNRQPDGSYTVGGGFGHLNGFTHQIAVIRFEGVEACAAPKQE